MTGLAACALGVAVAAMVATAAPTALADEAGTEAVGTQTESEEAVGAGGEMGAAVPDEPGSSSAATKGGTALLDVSPGSTSFNQGFELAARESVDVAWSVAVTDGAERSEALSGALLGPTSLLTLSFTFAAAEEDPEPSGESAFAVFSADDNSLTLYKRADAPVEGTSFLGKEATRLHGHREL